MSHWQILTGDVRETLATLEPQSVQTCVTSPPYWGLRDYGTASWAGGDQACDHAPRTQLRGTFDGGQPASLRDKPSMVCKCGARRIDSQIGLEPTPDDYVAQLVDVFRLVRTALKDDGTLWLNLGDSYAGSWGNQGRTEERGTQRAINGPMLTPVHDGRFPSHGSNTGKIPEGSGLKPKDLVGVPWMVAFALRADGWYLRSDIIWAKKNCMPESVTDRPTKAHEYLFMLSKQASYYYDAEAITEPLQQSSIDRVAYGWTTQKLNVSGSLARGETVATSMDVMGDRFAPAGGRNKRSVWHVATQPYPEAHFATFPEALIEPCILAGTSEKGQCQACGKAWVRVMDAGEVVRVREGSDTSGGSALEAAKGRHGSNSIFTTGAKRVHGTVGFEPQCACNAGDPVPQMVLDPFAGSGTTGAVATRHQRNFIGCELNPAYVDLARKRINGVAPLFAEERTA